MPGMDDKAGNGNNGGVLITFQQMYNELQRLVGELHDVNTAMKGHGMTAADHEIRLRALERWRYSLPISLVVAVGSGTIAIVSLFR